MSLIRTPPRGWLLVEQGEDGFSAKHHGLFVIASWGGDWEHVSVSLSHRCPEWVEMAFVKRQFWHPDDCVMQLHPPESDYVNCHPFCLHLWRPTNGRSIPCPPTYMLGPLGEF